MKRTTLFTQLTLALVFTSLISACSLVDLDEPGPTAPVDPPLGLPATAEELLTAIAGTESGRTWSAETFELEGLSGFQLCRLDDTFMFFTDGTYRYDGGEVLCGGEDDQRIKTGTWELDFENSQILFDRETSKEYTATIAAAEGNRMQLLGQVEIFGQLLDIEGIYKSE